jgi:hypothetical protein
VRSEQTGDYEDALDAHKFWGCGILTVLEAGVWQFRRSSLPGDADCPTEMTSGRRRD